VIAFTSTSVRSKRASWTTFPKHEGFGRSRLQSSTKHRTWLEFWDAVGSSKGESKNQGKTSGGNTSLKIMDGKWLLGSS
jgi:hypothetical protein